VAHREHAVTHLGPAWFGAGTSGDCAIVTAGGEFDMDSSVGLGDVVHDALSRSSSLVFDLTHVTFMDSTALGVLISARNRARDGGGSVSLVRPPDLVRRILAGTQLQRSFAVFGSVEQALAAVRTHADAP
jgi:anti-sigma B factor antagonist